MQENKTYDALMDSIFRFQSELADNERLALFLSVPGASGAMEVSSIGYANGSVLVFHGRTEGRKSAIIQHASQLNLQLTAVPKECGEPSHGIRGLGLIGFHAEDEQSAI